VEELWGIALIAVAGFLAGAINAVAGGGSIVSFPALLAVGLPPIAANVTNAVALLPGYASGTLAYRGKPLSLLGAEVRWWALLDPGGGLRHGDWGGGTAECAPGGEGERTPDGLTRPANG
jgi:hypothetical protein